MLVRKLNKNVIACARKYPFGTKMLIEEKIYVCEDRTKIKKYDGVFDILFRIEEERERRGKRILSVAILK